MAFGNGFRGPGAHRRRRSGDATPAPKRPRDDLRLVLEGVEAKPGRPAARTKKRRQPGEMNKTEAKYAAVLDARVQAGEVVEWWYESLTLKLAPNTHYRPDFLVLLSDGSLEVHEVKGGFVQEDAWIKSKIAAVKFPFRLVVVQWRDRQWHTVEI